MTTQAAEPTFPAIGSLGRLSALMCVVTALAGAFAEIALAWIWLSPRTVETYVVPGLGLGAVPVALDFGTRLAGFGISMVPLLVVFYMLHQAYELFDGYRLGHVFTVEAPKRLRRIGMSLVVIAALRPVTSMLLGLLLTAGNASGQRSLVIGISFDDVMLATIGGLILAIGHVMVEANRLADDNRTFI